MRGADSSRGTVRCEFRRAIYSSGHFLRFDVDTISLWDKGFVSVQPRAPATRINGSTRSIAGADRPRENPRFAIVRSWFDFRFARRISRQLNRGVKFARIVVDTINFD